MSILYVFTILFMRTFIKMFKSEALGLIACVAGEQLRQDWSAKLDREGVPVAPYGFTCFLKYGVATFLLTRPQSTTFLCWLDCSVGFAELFWRHYMNFTLNLVPGLPVTIACF